MVLEGQYQGTEFSVIGYTSRESVTKALEKMSGKEVDGQTVQVAAVDEKQATVGAKSSETAKEAERSPSEERSRSRTNSGSSAASGDEEKKMEVLTVKMWHWTFAYQTSVQFLIDGTCFAPNRKRTSGANEDGEKNGDDSETSNDAVTPELKKRRVIQRRLKRQKSIPQQQLYTGVAEIAKRTRKSEKSMVPLCWISHESILMLYMRDYNIIQDKCNDMTTQQAIEKRGREINLRCLENKQQLEKCNNRTAVNIAWKNFEEINDNYSATLYSCNEGKRKKRNYECISDNHNHGPRYHYSIEEFKGKLDDSRMKRHVHGTSDDKTDQQVENDNSKDSVRFKRYDCLKDSRREKLVCLINSRNYANLIPC
ncbi:hypothetical protein DINM_004660 [Dirofilaria immitis]|nr:hypothetical protein [Dirofilaria immitis]